MTVISRLPRQKRKLPNPVGDVVAGTRQIVEQGKVAAQRVKEGVRRIRKHVAK